MVGSRNAVLATLGPLGALVVLDAHDESYREERSPHFDASLVVAERAARRLVHIPMGRFGEATEIAAAAAFLASDDSSFMTASTFLVDGGISGAYVTPL